MRTMPNIEDIPIALVAAVARNKKGAMSDPLSAGEARNPSPLGDGDQSGGDQTLFGQASGGVIGRDCSIPWHLPADLAHFRKLTLDRTIIMGRCTYESIGRPLDRRINIVLSSRPDYRAEGCIVASSFEESLEKAASETCVDPDRTKDDGRPDILIIGGESIYHQALAVSRYIRFYLTLVDIDISGDTFFPKFDAGEWHENDHQEHKGDARNPHDMHFFDLFQRGHSLA